MLTIIQSMGIEGLIAYPLTIEVDIATGMAAFEIVGLPDTAVKESRDRVQSALKNCGYHFPVQKITINMAPATVKKTGALYDLPLLLGILRSTQQLKCTWGSSIFLGELSLSGTLRPIHGVLPMAIAAQKQGVQNMFLPMQNVLEASVVKGLHVFGISHVKEVIDFFAGEKQLQANAENSIAFRSAVADADFCDVKGQRVAKRALEVAAAGGHNVLMVGAPGSGKSMLAKRFASILPKITFEEAIETSNIYSIAGMLTQEQPLVVKRPFRAPHHSISASGLAGGGVPPRPGEISLANHGVLFLDELPEFRRDAKEVLRQPMEDRMVRINRSGKNVVFPCAVTIVAAMNPCPCGYYGHPTRECSCTPAKIHNYLARVSGPLLDRLDLHVDVAPVEFDALTSLQKEETSREIQKRVERARAVQIEKFKGRNYTCNAHITPADLERFCLMTDAARKLLKDAFEKLGLSGRAYDRLLKTARTIADLDREEQIGPAHIGEAIQYRTLDRKYWVL